MNDSGVQARIERNLLLVGGGHSHVIALRRFGMRPLPGVRITVVAREVHTPYSGMLPGYIAGRYTLDECHIDLRPLCRFANARLVHDEVIALDPQARRVELAGPRPPLGWDLLSIDIGSSPALHAIEGAEHIGIPVKPIGAFVKALDAMIERTASSATPRRLVVVGGGAGGVELVLNVEARIRSLGLGADRVTLALVTGRHGLLPDANARTRRIFTRVLGARGIQVLDDTGDVVRAGPVHLITERGTRIDHDDVIWATSASPAPWIATTGLAVDARGFLLVDAHLRSVSHPSVFAAGDIATNRDHPRPRSGVYAVRQGRPLAENLRRALRDEPTRAFTPQRHHLRLIGTGDGHAVASRGPLVAAHGRWLWRLKDRIDRRFIARFTGLPAMHTDTAESAPDEATALTQLAETPMRCGGCGSKVGADVLGRALARVRSREVADRVEPGPGRVVVGLDTPDDAAVLEIPSGMWLVQSLDWFRTLVDDPWLLGAIGANHALGDLHAMGARPRTALALATVPWASEAQVEDDLVQLLSGALHVLDVTGTELVGGHTTEGHELAFGLQVTGLVAPDAVLRKSGARAGQALILTRAVGTGVLFAADMRGLARGRQIERALVGMTRSSHDAAAALIAHGATACTDVTGFGLVGHLHEILVASGASATLSLDALPVLEGAVELVGAGVFSTLHPHNVRMRRAIETARPETRHDPRFALLFDPQTAGGLLASVPAERASACVATLRGLGHGDSVIVGHVGDEAPGTIRVV